MVRSRQFYNFQPDAQMDLSAQWENREPTTRNIGAISLRAPEVILGANFNTKVDIWALGCMVSSCGAIVTRPSNVWLTHYADF
jgi:serine/threonine protein kinase